jgi:PAS domain S-box-containing protein
MMQLSENVNILLVDDQPKNLLALSAVLDSLGQNLVTATSGEQALKCLLQQEFAVILLDVQMPVMDGFETAKLIRSRPSLQHTPIIFITAINRDDTYVQKGYSLGAVDYLLKPIVPEILLSKVAAFISLFQTTQEVKRQAAQLQATNIKLEREIAKRQQAEEALRQLNEKLEIKVQERTAELARSNELLRAEILERQRTEEALKLTQFSVDRAVDAIAWIHPDSHFLYVNDKTCHSLGYSREELLSMSVPDVDPDVPATAWPDFWQQLKQKGFLSFESHHCCKDGTIFPVEITANYIEFNGKEYACCSARNISERTQVQEALRISEERFRTALKNSPIVVFNQDTNLRYTWIYHPALGFTAEEIMGKLDSELFPPEDAQRLKAIKNRVLKTGVGTREETFTTVNGDVRYFDLTVEPLFNQAKEILGITCAAMDITEKKQAEETRLAWEAEKEMRRLQLRFFSMASHEFRTPLGAILGSAQILESCPKEWPESKKLKNLHRIKGCVKHLTQLLDDILIINRAETGKLEFNPCPIELEKFCRQLVEEMNLTTGAKNPITFVCQVQCPPANLDEKLLRSVLTNLLSNAVKYSPQAGKVHLGLTYEQEAIIFTIQDQGIGIPREDQKHLFELFHRGKNIENIPGTGLGLSIVKKCLDLQGGKISLKSELGVGTTVTITIPRRVGSLPSIR